MWYNKEVHLVAPSGKHNVFCHGMEILCNGLLKFWANCWMLICTHYQELMKSVGSHGNYQQKISGVMCFKHYLWVVNLFLCGRVRQLYGNQAIVVVCKIVIVRQKISGVMRFKHYPWVVNLFLCGRVWQLYGNQAIVVVCKIVIVKQKISGVMRFKHYPWVVNVFLCGRVWQLYGNQAIVVVYKIVIVRHRFCWGVAICGSRYGVARNPSVILVWSRYMIRFSVLSFADLSRIMKI
jgi:hypothetical protein